MLLNGAHTNKIVEAAASTGKTVLGKVVGDAAVGGSVAKNAQVSELSSMPLQSAANYLPNLAVKKPPFQGRAVSIKQMSAYSPDGTRYILKKAADGSYLVDAETVTKVYYGKDAANMLSRTTKFANNTQVIASKDSLIIVEVDGQKIPINSSGAVVIGAGKEAKINVVKGAPLVITSERPPVWYEQYGLADKKYSHAKQFFRLTELNYHLYSGHLKISDLGPKIVKKLLAAKIAKPVGENYIEMVSYSTRANMAAKVKPVLTKKEQEVFKTFYDRAYRVRATTKAARKAISDGLSPSIREKLTKNGLIVDLTPYGKNQIYWKTLFPNKNALQRELQNLGIVGKEADEIVSFWKRTNKLGFDFTGLRYLSEDIAIYNLDKKLNNWSLGPTEWASHSNAVSSTAEGSLAPYIGVSEVRCEHNYPRAIPFKEIRPAEVLHSHPNQIDKHQSELYMVTNGMGAITVLENDRPRTIVLKSGQGMLIQPGVKHFVSAVRGDYEHLVCQIPSTFQYGFAFKKEALFPPGYSEVNAANAAIRALDKVKFT